jgi:O-antigen ligase
VDSPLLIGAALVLFVLAFARTEIGLYIVVFSMLLSPEITAGGGLAERRELTFRTEDFVLIVIGFSWFAKTAVNKELGLVAKTPLNGPIIAYIAVNVIATLLGYLMGSVRTAAGYFYVLKYIEYFVVYYMVVNNLRDRAHARRLVIAALVTAGIVSVIGLTQIPSGERVSAPFEGETGEPNTFGGYLLFMMAITAGIALESTSFTIRARVVGLLALMALPFAFTLSRASYLGVLPAFLALTALTKRRRALVAVLLLVVVCSPLLLVVAPASIVNRIMYTFQPEANQPTVRVGKVGLDPSTSARLLSLGQALSGWTERPILGWGVTGFGFMDAQYARVLVETGIVGFLIFVWLLWSVLRAARGVHVRMVDPIDRGLAMGFIAGTIGLLAHAIGSNTFTIIRIMEPFWLFAGIVVMLPVLASEEPRTAPAPLSTATATAPAPVVR